MSTDLVAHTFKSVVSLIPIPTTITVVYCGKFTHAHYAPTTIISVVVPEGIRENKPCLILWQWAVTAATDATASQTNYNMEFTGHFVEKVSPMVECRNTANSTWFKWNLRTNQMIMMDTASNTAFGQPISLEKVYPLLG